MAGPLIVDAHLHLYRSGEEGLRSKETYEIWEYGAGPGVHFSAFAGDPDDAVAALAAAGASHAVVTNLLDEPAPGVDPGDDLRAFNGWLCDLARRLRQFIPFLAVDPGRLGVADLVTHIREMVADHGARGIKIHPPLQRLDLADRALWPIFATCRELGIGIVAHAGPSRSGPQFGEPDAFRPLLAAFPELRISLAHLGGAAWRQTAALARDFPRVYFDCCEIVEWLGAPSAPTRDDLVRLVREIGVERVMLGSDFPWYDIDHSLGVVFDLPGLSQAERELIAGVNAARFLGFDT